MRMRKVSEASDGDYRGCGRLRPIAVAVAVLGVIAMLVGANAQAATIIVNSTADDTSAGHCRLREAINSANGTSSDTGACTAGDGDDTIKFSVSGTIMLTSTLPEVLRALTIQGPSRKPSGIDGGGEYEVMSVSSGARVKLANLTVENGLIASSNGPNANAYGGGILNNGTLTVTNSAISHNTAGRLLPGAPTRYGIGGGIANFGTLTVTDSTFSGNTAGKPPRLVASGGGIANIGTLTVTNSTFSGNAANLVGGGIGNQGTVTVTNSTFVSNVAICNDGGGNLQGLGGGISDYLRGTVTVTGSTFFRNIACRDGGGISHSFSGSTFYLKGTVLADNTISGDGSLDNCGGTITDVGYNISDDESCGFTQETSANDRDPRLDPAGLKDNGGPTETVALEPNSPAIDAIPLHECTDQASPPSRISTDQRGALRPDAGEDTCDIGAYEFQGFAGRPNCNGKSVSALAHRGGSWTNALLAALKDYLHGRKAHEQMGVVLAPAIGPVLGYGSLAAAASAYGFPSVKALQSAIQVSCGR